MMLVIFGILMISSPTQSMDHNCSNSEYSDVKNCDISDEMSSATAFVSHPWSILKYGGVESYGISGEMYSSAANMNQLFYFDHRLGQHLHLLPQHVVEVARYKESYDIFTKDVQALGNGDYLSPAITGNPIILFSLFKRLVVYWPVINTLIEKTYNLTEHQRMDAIFHLGKLTVLPNDKDMRGISLSLARLQEVYRIPPYMFAAGIIADVHTSVRLNAFDCMRIANESLYTFKYANAYLWYRQAEIIARDPEIKNLIKLLKGQVVLEHDRNFRERTQNFFPALLSSRTYQFPWDTPFHQLCRGDLELIPSITARLKCYFSSRGSPYFVLQPIKYERVAINPEMYVFYDVISDKEIQTLKDVSSLAMERSMVISSDNPVETRLSHTAWLMDMDDPLLPKISRRISDITGLHVAEGPPDNVSGEPIQMESYGIAGHYDRHNDSFWKERPEDQWQWFRDNFIDFHSGDRLATWMFYLSDVQAGGRTVFPSAGVSVIPVKGSAVFWYNIKKNGIGNDPYAEHGGCPVLLGHKLVANKWIRENPNFLRRPCGLSLEEQTEIL